MNSIFKHWTTSTAFSLQLTSESVQDLLFMAHGNADCRRNNRDPLNYPYQFEGRRTSSGYLLRRGLISPVDGGYCLTAAGELVCKLLEEAGFKPQREYGTMFPSVVCTS